NSERSCSLEAALENDDLQSLTLDVRAALYDGVRLLVGGVQEVHIFEVDLRRFTAVVDLTTQEKASLLCGWILSKQSDHEGRDVSLLELAASPDAAREASHLQSLVRAAEAEVVDGPLLNLLGYLLQQVEALEKSQLRTQLKRKVHGRLQTVAARIEGNRQWAFCKLEGVARLIVLRASWRKYAEVSAWRRAVIKMDGIARLRALRALWQKLVDFLKLSQARLPTRRVFYSVDALEETPWKRRPGRDRGRPRPSSRTSSTASTAQSAWPRPAKSSSSRVRTSPRALPAPHSSTSARSADGASPPSCASYSHRARICHPLPKGPLASCVSRRTKRAPPSFSPDTEFWPSFSPGRPSLKRVSVQRVAKLERRLTCARARVASSPRANSV
ncbi:hypothetical protein M885DRAFT_232069, partial [Pelagophyceae sp. CCMP2097]